MEYYELLGLSKEPFSMTPDPQFFFHTKQHVECLNRLEISLRLNRGLNLVIGGIGTGKTMLSRLLLGRFVEFGRNYQFYLILDPTWENNREFLMHLRKLFGIEEKAMLQPDMMNQIEHFLIDSTLNAEKQIVLIIDEGQKMGPEQVEIIRTLLNFETNEIKLIETIIFAQPEFQEVLNDLESFRDRIAFGCVISAMDLDDTVNFIDHRLKVAGLQDGELLFTPRAKELIYEHTHGYPRRIVIMCHNLIIEMMMAGSEKIDASSVLERMKISDPFRV